MASKASATKSTTKSSKSVKASKTTKSKTGMTAAQSAAYSAASKKAIAAAQLTANASALRQRRLASAANAQNKLAAKRAQLISSRIARNAVRATYNQNVYAKQSHPLVVQSAHSLFKKQSVATNRQFAYSGEAIHARTTVLQTLTSGQAISQQKIVSAKARAAATARSKTAKKVSAKTTVKARTSKSSPYAAIGRAAGQKAAAKVPASKTRTSVKGATVASTEWIVAGNDTRANNCVAVAIANSLLMATGERWPDWVVNEIDRKAGRRLDRALTRLYFHPAWGLENRIWDFRRVSSWDREPGMIVGFSVNGKAHCGVLKSFDKVVSWGEVLPLESTVEECWAIEWQAYSR